MYRTTTRTTTGTTAGIRRPAASRSLGLAALALTALTGLAACGSDDDDVAGDTTTVVSVIETTGSTEPTQTTEPTASTETSANGQVQPAACQAAIDYAAASAMAPEAPEEVGPWASDTLAPIAEQWVAGLDDAEANAAATTLAATIAEIAESGDPSALFGPEGSASLATIGKAVHEGCELEAVDIEAIDYAYEGVPAELPAGPTSFALTNTGIEEHEMVLFKRAEGATETLDEVLELPEEELFSTVQFTGVTFGGPDTTNYVALDLEPGTYFLVCFIPQGGDEEGPPHFMAGMKETIEVV